MWSNNGSVDTNDWERLAFGEPSLPLLRRISLVRRLRSARAYLTACFIYRNDGFSKASDYLHLLSLHTPPLGASTNEEAVRQARRTMAFFRCLGRLAHEDLLCLPAATSLTAGLIALGLPAQLVVGKAEYLLNKTYDFHAWTEINGIPINDKPIVRQCYLPLLKWPDWKHHPHMFN